MKLAGRVAILDLVAIRAAYTDQLGPDAFARCSAYR